MSAALFALVKARAKYSMTLAAHQQLKCSMTLTARQQLTCGMYANQFAVTDEQPAYYSRHTAAQYVS